MATYTSNYAWTKPSGNDNVDISVLNANLDSQDSVIHDAFMNMAQAFSESSTYEVGDIVVYQTTTYKCHTAVTTAGSWTGSTNWQVYKLSEGGGSGLTLGETSSTAYRGDRGKTAYDHSQTTGNPHGTTAAEVGLGNVPNVSTNDQTPTFTEASTRNNIASGEKLSVILGKIAKFFNDLKTVAFSGNASDLNYDNTTSGLSATKVQGAVDEVVRKLTLKTTLKTFTNLTLNGNKEAVLGTWSSFLPSGVSGRIMLIEICSAATGSGPLRLETGSVPSATTNVWLIGNQANQTISSLTTRTLYYED